MSGLSNVPLKEVLLVIYGGLFGYVLSKLPSTWVYAVLGVAIIMTIVLVL